MGFGEPGAIACISPFTLGASDAQLPLLSAQREVPAL